MNDKHNRNNTEYAPEVDFAAELQRGIKDQSDVRLGDLGNLLVNVRENADAFAERSPPLTVATTEFGDSHDHLAQRPDFIQELEQTRSLVVVL